MKRLSLGLVLLGSWVPAFGSGDEYAVTAQEAFSLIEEEGDRAKEGPMAGRRVVNGWQNSGLPWESKMDPGKIFRPDPTNKKECGVFLPNRGIGADSLIPGVGVAQPQGIARAISQPSTITLGF